MFHNSNCLPAYTTASFNTSLSMFNFNLANNAFVAKTGFLSLQTSPALVIFSCSTTKPRLQLLAPVKTLNIIDVAPVKVTISCLGIQYVSRVTRIKREMIYEEFGIGCLGLVGIVAFCNSERSPTLRNTPDNQASETSNSGGSLSSVLSKVIQFEEVSLRWDLWDARSTRRRKPSIPKESCGEQREAGQFASSGRPWPGRPVQGLSRGQVCPTSESFVRASASEDESEDDDNDFFNLETQVEFLILLKPSSIYINPELFKH
ncbi:unnamed protein product [Protopolystoma xenopodis]|uniref:Uncharacterized protein n=1 Tax=Protopolystoma xenopodis TaxID=117903 RepID=A0A3S5CRU1_9PLAT|nr:unnamed protein product [Protopolystoma xenopodis]